MLPSITEATKYTSITAQPMYLLDTSTCTNTVRMAISTAATDIGQTNHAT